MFSWAKEFKNISPFKDDNDPKFHHLRAAL
jgi:hypothetical protein